MSDLEAPVNNMFGWYVGIKNDKHTYLHSDLKLRRSTSYQGKSTGYFETEAEALKCIYRYNSPWHENL